MPVVNESRNLEFMVKGMLSLQSTYTDVISVVMPACEDEEDRAFVLAYLKEQNPMKLVNALFYGFASEWVDCSQGTPCLRDGAEVPLLGLSRTMRLAGIHPASLLFANIGRERMEGIFGKPTDRNVPPNLKVFKQVASVLELDPAFAMVSEGNGNLTLRNDQGVSEIPDGMIICGALKTSD